MEKEKLVKKLIEFVGFEEEITFELTKNYLDKLKNSELTEEEKQEVKKRLKILLKETNEHYDKFTALIEKIKKTNKKQF